MAEELEASAEAESLVRALLHEALRARQRGRVADGSVREHTRAMCAFAHARGLPIERVIVTLKQEWRETPEARHLERFEATTVLERIVTLCITEFYADTPAH